MNTGTRALVGIAILALGGATFWIAGSQAQVDVRYVQDVLADPVAHRHGEYTLMGVPQPREIPLTGPNGTYLAPNAEWRNATQWTTTWSAGGTTYFSTATLELRTAGAQAHWVYRNETRRSPADRDLALPAQEESWAAGAAGAVFAVEAFEGGPAGPPRVWAFYDKAPEHPLQPKPSQFRGHFMTTAPDGQALPPGALIWQVDGYTAGCSSKFLPPATQAKYNMTA